MCFHSVRSDCWQSLQCNQCLSVLRPYQKPQFKVCSTCRPSPSCAFSFCTSEEKSLCIPPVSHHHRTQCLCVPVCAFHPPAIHRCNQCVCVQHLCQQPQFTVCSTCLRIQLPHPQRAFSAQHVLGHRSPPRHSCATDYSLPSCTFSARHLWVTVIFGRGFQVVVLHFAALLLQSLQHQSSPREPQSPTVWAEFCQANVMGVCFGTRIW